jgi:hypothetical protein
MALKDIGISILSIASPVVRVESRRSAYDAGGRCRVCRHKSLDLRVRLSASDDLQIAIHSFSYCRTQCPRCLAYRDKAAGAEVPKQQPQLGPKS